MDALGDWGHDPVCTSVSSGHLFRSTQIQARDRSCDSFQSSFTVPASVFVGESCSEEGEINQFDEDLVGLMPLEGTIETPSFVIKSLLDIEGLGMLALAPGVYPRSETGRASNAFLTQPFDDCPSPFDKPSKNESM